MILNTPITTNMPTPTAIPPISKTGLIDGTCLETIMMLGSATVIKAPNAKENNITINKLFCLDKDEPMYSPTLVKLMEAPTEKRERPEIRINMPMKSNK